VTSAQFSWIRSDLSNLRTLLSWVRTAVSMIGFGFTIYNFYAGFFPELGTPGLDTAARNLGLALVGFGTLSMGIAVWNYWTINRYLQASSVALAVPRGLRLRWAFSYLAAAIITGIGFVTFLFMLRVL
jgi:putative membrane protein